MTILSNFLKRTAEKYLGRYYEGPEPPERLTSLLVAFANDHPKADRATWVGFTTLLVQEAYKSGYTRGYEYVERTFDWRNDLPPEVIADMIDPNWKWGPGLQLKEAGGVVPLDPPTDEEILRSQSEEVFLTGARTR